MASVLRTLALGAAAVVLSMSVSAAAVGADQAARPAETTRPAQAVAKPMHIMSMNLCTDLLLLQMVPKARIASVSFLAHDAVQDLFPGADAGIAVNHATSEDIVNEKPDLILADDYSMLATRRLAARALHAPLVGIKSANSFADIRTAIRQVGAAVGEPARAEAMIRRMDATLAQIAATPLPRRLRVVAWSGDSSVPGKGTLTDAIIDAAGAENIAAQPNAQNGTFDIEQLLAADPDAVLYATTWQRQPSLRAEQGQHRLVRELYGSRRITYNDVPHSCGLPQSADSARDIHRALLALPPKRPLP